LASRLFGEDLVYRGALEVALGEGVVTVKDEGDVFTVVDVAFGANPTCDSAIGINAFGDAAVEGVVGVVNLAGDGAACGRELSYSSVLNLRTKSSSSCLEYSNSGPSAITATFCTIMCSSEFMSRPLSMYKSNAH
jgi:hypothetical protein